VRSEGDYSLIVDGTAAVTRGNDGQRLLITPAKAVLHRPAEYGASRAHVPARTARLADEADDVHQMRIAQRAICRSDLIEGAGGAIVLGAAACR